MGALGSCMAITARLYAQRKGWPLEGVEVALDYERFVGKEYEGYEGNAAFVHEIRNHIILRGPLDDEQRERLLEIANIFEMKPEEVLSFDDKLVFSNNTHNDHASVTSLQNYGTIQNVISEKIVQLYEDKIKLLEEQVEMLKEKIRGLEGR